MKKLIKYASTALASLALFVGIFTANSACYLLCGQPNEPETLKKYKF